VVNTLQRPLGSHTGESPGNEKQNRCSLRFSLNAVNDEAEVTYSGSVFQMRVPATGKVQEPMEVSRTAGTIRSSEIEDQSVCLSVCPSVPVSVCLPGAAK